VHKEGLLDAFGGATAAEAEGSAGFLCYDACPILLQAVKRSLLDAEGRLIEFQHCLLHFQVAVEQLSSIHNASGLQHYSKLDFFSTQLVSLLSDVEKRTQHLKKVCTGSWNGG
jgi:hypothetical protein